MHEYPNNIVQVIGIIMVMIGAIAGYMIARILYDKKK